MKYLLVAGDSFAACSAGWPSMLANKLELELVQFGIGGQHWIGVKNFLDNLSADVLDNAQAIVLAHTNADRIPNANPNLGPVNYDNPKTQLEQAAVLYYQHIHDAEFLSWAQRAWFKELAQRFADKKIIHLHSFPWTVELTYLLSGVSVTPSLMSVSLNEINAESMSLFKDSRLNHLNQVNNQALADQLADIFLNYTPGTCPLDLTKFDQLTQKWTNHY